MNTAAPSTPSAAPESGFVPGAPTKAAPAKAKKSFSKGSFATTKPTFVLKPNLDSRVDKEMVKVKKLHFVSPVNLLAALDEQRYHISYSNERQYGFHALQFTPTSSTDMMDQLSYDNISFSIHYHHMVSTYDDKYGKTYGILEPYPFPEDYPIRETVLLAQKKEAEAILRVNFILARTAENQFGDNSKNPNLYVQNLSPTELSKLKFKLPEKIKGEPFNLSTLTKNISGNNDLCISIAGAYAFMDDEDKNRMLVGIKFKLMPWLHQWYYDDEVVTPKTGKNARRSTPGAVGRKRIKAERVETPVLASDTWKVPAEECAVSNVLETVCDEMKE